jgi:phospholipase/carboxylesterase
VSGEPFPGSYPGHEPPVEIETGRPAVASVIWLHGLGADGHDFEPIVPELELPPSAAVRFVFPHAPYRPVTINNGYVMRAWYDMALTGQGYRLNEKHLREAGRTLTALIRRENDRGVPSARIVLAGFSQGGAVVLNTGLDYSEQLAGILALSAAPFPPGNDTSEGRPQANRTTPVFLAHGIEDTVVPFVLAQEARHRLAARGQRAVEWREYPMGHGVSAEEIRDISVWLTRVLCL